MNIILGTENIDPIKDRYIILELDSFRFASNADPVTAYCLVSDVNFETLLQLEQWQDLHRGLIKNYKQANWNYCEQALDHLRGQWNGELDSFYDELQSRIQELKIQCVDTLGWDSVIDRSQTSQIPD